MTSHATSMGRRGNLVAAIATIAACDIAMGLTLQLLPLSMEQAGIPAWFMGVNAAMGPIGILLAGPFLPQIIGHVGSKRMAYGAIACLVAMMIAFKLAPSYWLWFPIRLVFGLAAGTLFTISEAWILTFASDETRGRVMSIYTSILAITFSVGPLIIPFTGVNGWAPWLLGSACIAISVIPLAFVTVSDDAFKPKDGASFFRFFARAPVLLFAVGAATLFDSVFISFFTIFGLRHGLELETASHILGIGIIGNVLLFYPIGLIADRWSRRGVVLTTVIATIVLSLALPILIRTPVIWPATILLTTSAFGVYVVALAIMGDTFKGADVVAGSAAFAAMWGVGGLAGPPIAGAAIDHFGIDAMPATLAGFYVLLLLGMVFTGGHLVRGAPRG